jgi:cytochrome c-type biogenesis protein
MSHAPLLYAFTLGLVAALNPCGFPLLPAYLTGFVGAGSQPWPARTARALGSAAAVTVGFVAVFAPLGALVSAGVDVVLGWVPWAMIPFGLAMVAVGGWTAAGRSLKVRLPALRPWAGARRHPVAAMVLFGVAYAVASLSCALPVFVAGVSGAFGRSGVAHGLADVVAYALGMGLLLAVAALVVAHAGAGALRGARRLGPGLQRLVGVVLAVVGAYLVLYWASFVADPSSTPGPVRAVEHVQATVVSWLSGAPRTIGALLGVAVVGALAALVAARSDRRAVPPSAPASASAAAPAAAAAASDRAPAPAEPPPDRRPMASPAP